MGIPIKRIIKTVTKQTPDIVQDVANRTAQTVRAVNPTTITTPTGLVVPDIRTIDPATIRMPDRSIIPDISTVTPNRTIVNRLGVPIGIGSDVRIDNGHLAGTLFSGNKRYDLSKIYDDFELEGIDSSSLDAWVNAWLLDSDLDYVLKKLPLTADFKPQLDFVVNNGRYTKHFTPRTYAQLMSNSGYRNEVILRGMQNGSYDILNGTGIFSRHLLLDDNFQPMQMTAQNVPLFTSDYFKRNLNEDTALEIFYNALRNSFDGSYFNPHSGIEVKFSPVNITDKMRVVSEMLSSKYPQFNFDPSLQQFTPQFSGQNVPTINFLRQKFGYLPFDFSHFNWNQGKIRSEGWGVRGAQPKVGMEVYKDMGKLKEGMPRGYAITEINTSPDSEVLKLTMARKNYGTNPGQASIKILNKGGNRNTLQNSRLWIEDLLNDPQIPQSEKSKLIDLHDHNGVFNADEWIDTEMFKRAQILFNQRAVESMQKLYQGWHELKKLDPGIGDFNISTTPFSMDDFEELYHVGNTAPELRSPDFHVIKNKNGGRFLENWNLAINKLKNNNKFGN